MNLETQIIKEVKMLIEQAFFQANEAEKKHDFETAEFFKCEAFDLMAKLPENRPYLKNEQ